MIFSGDKFRASDAVAEGMMAERAERNRKKTEFMVKKPGLFIRDLGSLRPFNILKKLFFNILIIRAMLNNKLYLIKIQSKKSWIYVI